MLASYKLSGKYIFISGFLFTSVLGTLSHFFYEWSGDSTFIGLVCPISESAWEHMKLLFFPALLYCFLFKLIYKNAVPNVSLPLLSGILTGTTLIPVSFILTQAYSALRLSGSILLFFTFVLESLFQWHPNYMSRKISHVSASSYMD